MINRLAIFKSQLSKFFQKYWLILAILLLGFLLRVYGIYFDYPYGVNFIWDEIFSVSYLLDIFEYKTLFTSMPYQYPLLLPLLYLPGLILRIIYIALIHGLTSINELKNYLVMSGMGQIYIIVRWYSVLFGTATIYLIYRIYSLIAKSKFSAYFSSLVYTISFIPVFMAHWGKAHIIMTFFLVWSLYFVLKFEQEKKIKYWYWSVVMSACSWSIHYLGISAIIFPILSLVINRKEFIWKIIIKSILIYSVFILTFYLINFRGLQGIWGNNAGYLLSTGFTGMYAIGQWERFYYVIRDSFLLDPIFISLFIIMVSLNFKKIIKDKLLRYILIGLLFNYFIMSTLVAWPKMSRWLLVFNSLALPLGAFLLAEYLTAKNLKKVWLYFITIILLIPNIYFIGLWLNLLNNNTRLETSQWLQKNLKKSEVAYSFDMYLDAPLSYDAALWQRDNNHLELSKKLQLIISHEKDFKDKGIDLRYDFGYNRYQNLAGPDTKYIIIFYALSGEEKGWFNYTTRKTAYEILDNIKKYHQLKLVKTYSPTDNQKLINSGVEDYLNNPLSWSTLIHLNKSGSFYEIYQIL